MTTTPSDQSLKLALAGMLPENIKATPSGEFFWCNPIDPNEGPIKETEWLHVCWLVEQELGVKYGKYHVLLWDYEGGASYYVRCFNSVSASWQSRAIALCNVKGVEV